MSDKERLEEIETKYSTLTVSSEKNGMEYTEVDVEDLVFLIQNGFEQAERVEELELEVSDWRAEVQKWEQFYEESERRHLVTRELLHLTISENQRYKQALKKISNADWNSEGLDAERELDRVTDIAIKALEGTE